jgi:hypothetical protein
VLCIALLVWVSNFESGMLSFPHSTTWPPQNGANFSREPLPFELCRTRCRGT